MRKLLFLLCVPVVTLAGTPSSAPNAVDESAAVSDSPWRFRLAPYAWLTSTSGTIGAGPLSAVALNPEPVLDRASWASTDEEAVYFVQMARLLENHHRQSQPLVSLVAVEGIPCAIDKTGTAVVPVGADLVRWTPSLEASAREFVAWSSDKPEVKRLLLVTDGALSPQATEGLSRLGIDVAAQALGAPR